MAARHGDAPGAPLLTVAAVARRLGVAPATLRTWDRRYGLGPSERIQGAHRRYGTTDLARLLVMRRLTIDGVAPAEAAQIARTAQETELFEPPPEVERPDERGNPAHEALVDAALAGDEAGVERLVELRPGDDLLAWWATLVEPALAAISRRMIIDHPGTSPLVTVGSAALAVMRGAVPPAAAGRPVVLVLAPGVRIAMIQVHAIAAALAARGVDARVVSGQIAPRHAVELAAMTRASAVISVSDVPNPDLKAIERLASERPELPQFAMLPDVAGELLPLGRSVYRARTVTGVVHETLAAVGLTGTGQPRASVRASGGSHRG